MARKRIVEYSLRELLTKKRDYPVRHVKDSEIDYSDIPALSDEQLKNMKPVTGRPWLGESPRVPISVRIESDVLKGLKKKAKKMKIGYQTLINEILKKAV